MAFYGVANNICQALPRTVTAQQVPAAQRRVLAPLLADAADQVVGETLGDSLRPGPYTRPLLSST
jgi:hypothetical protein